MHCDKESDWSSDLRWPAQSDYKTAELSVLKDVQKSEVGFSLAIACERLAWYLLLDNCRAHHFGWESLQSKVLPHHLFRKHHAETLECTDEENFLFCMSQAPSSMFNYV